MIANMVPDAEHIVRYCSPSKIANGEIQASAFFLKTDEEYLSANCIECLKKDTRKDAINEILTAYDRKDFKVNKDRGLFAFLNVGCTRDKVRNESQDNRDITVRKLSLSVDPSYCGIFNLKEDNELIAEFINPAVK